MLNIFIVMEIRKELKSSLDQQHKFYDLVSLCTREKSFYIPIFFTSYRWQLSI